MDYLSVDIHNIIFGYLDCSTLSVIPLISKKFHYVKSVVTGRGLMYSDVYYGYLGLLKNRLRVFEYFDEQMYHRADDSSHIREWVQVMVTEGKISDRVCCGFVSYARYLERVNCTEPTAVENVVTVIFATMARVAGYDDIETIRSYFSGDTAFVAEIAMLVVTIRDKRTDLFKSMIDQVLVYDALPIFQGLCEDSEAFKYTTSEILRCVAEKYRTYDCCFCSNAAFVGNLELMEECRIALSLHRWDVQSNAIKNGHYHILEYCVNNGYGWGENTVTESIRTNDVTILAYCIENGCPWSPGDMQCAMISGNLDILNYCIDNGGKWEPDDLHPLMRRGCSLEILERAISAGCPWSSEMFALAAINGNFILFEWMVKNLLLKHSPYLNETTWCFDAEGLNAEPYLVLSGRLDLLKRYRAAICDNEFINIHLYRSCETSQLIKLAERNGHSHMLEYLRENPSRIDNLIEDRTCERDDVCDYVRDDDLARFM